MNLSIIVAMTEDGVIGKNNQLPWHLSEDLKRFKALTMGHPIIMGRKTFESIGKPLPGRLNIVLTRDPGYRKEGVAVVHNLDEALVTAGKEESPFVIGGADVFKLALPQANQIYLTLIHKKFEGDTFFPKIDLKKEFKTTEKTTHHTTTDGGFDYSFFTATRNPN